MANPVMGAKRQCLSCNAKFYDLSKDPIVCPKCGATFEPVALVRSPPRRVGRSFSSSAQPFEDQAATASEAKADDIVEADDADEAEDEENEENPALIG